MFTKAGRPQWDVKQIIKSLPTEEPVQNPVVYRVRVIAMTCLVVVHTLCRSASGEIHSVPLLLRRNLPNCRTQRYL